MFHSRLLPDVLRSAFGRADDAGRDPAQAAGRPRREGRPEGGAWEAPRPGADAPGARAAREPRRRVPPREAVAARHLGTVRVEPEHPHRRPLERRRARTRAGAADRAPQPCLAPVSGGRLPPAPRLRRTGAGRDGQHA